MGPTWVVPCDITKGFHVLYVSVDLKILGPQFYSATSCLKSGQESAEPLSSSRQGSNMKNDRSNLKSGLRIPTTGPLAGVGEQSRGHSFIFDQKVGVLLVSDWNGRTGRSFYSDKIQGAGLTPTHEHNHSHNPWPETGLQPQPQPYGVSVSCIHLNGLEARTQTELNPYSALTNHLESGKRFPITGAGQKTIVSNTKIKSMTIFQGRTYRLNKT